MDSQVKTRRRGRPSSEDHVISREALLDAALKLFGELGYEGFSIRDFARRTGVSHGLVSARFGSKDELWRTAVDRGMRGLLSWVEKPAHDNSPTERLRAAAANVLMALWANPAVLQLANYEGARDTERLGYIVASEPVSQILARFGEIIDAGVALGLFRETSPVLFFLLLAHGGGAVLCLKPLARQRGLLPEGGAAEAERHAGAIADMLIRGIRR